jgi:hypothetical protein
MDGVTGTSANPFEAPQWPVGRSFPADDTLRPEVAILQRRFEDWRRELRDLWASENASDVVSIVLDGPIRYLRHVAEVFDGELRRSREPEDLRRLLSHGQRLTRQLAVRRAGLDESRRIGIALAGLCERLMLESRFDDESVVDLLKSLRQAAADGDRPWVLWDAALNDLSADAVDAVRKGWRDAAARIVTVGVPSARLAARVAMRIGFGARETAATLFAALLQDCGYLLLERHRGSPLDDHPRYGAALAAGLKRIPTEALSAIAGHHAMFFPARRVDCLVAVVGSYVESTLRRETPPMFAETSAGDFRGEVVTALQAELSRIVVPGPVEAADAPAVPDQSHRRESISPPHFHVLQNSFRSSTSRAK